jgi:hypothetical protein
MAFELDWLVENRLIYCRLYDEVTVEDLARSDRLIRHMLHTGIVYATMPTHVVMNVAEVRKLPRTLEASKALTAHSEPGIGKMVFFGVTTPAMHSAIHMIYKVIRVSVELFDTPENAMRFLESLEETPLGLMDALQSLRRNEKNIGKTYSGVA